MASTSTASDSGTLIQNRRLIVRYSLSSSSPLATTGSSAMPHLGQSSGWS